MNIDPNLEKYPRLVPPEVVYEHKASLKKSLVIPLYAKVTAAAAAVALLFGIFWSRSLTPHQELMASLEPVAAGRITTEEPAVLAESQARFIVPKRAKKSSSPTIKPEVSEKPVASERVEMPLLAGLQPKTAAGLPTQDSPVFMMDSPLMPEAALAYREPEEENELSMLRKGLLKMTDGQYDSFSSMFSEGWRKAKTELAMAKEQTFSLPLQKIRDYDLELHHLEP